MSGKTMIKPWKFALNTREAILLGGCITLASLSFVVVGFAGGVLFASRGGLAHTRFPLGLPKTVLSGPPKASSPGEPPKSPVATLAVPATPVATVAVAGPGAAALRVVSASPPDTLAAAPAATAPAAAAPATLKPVGLTESPFPLGMAVQVGSFRVEENAVRLLAQLKRRGYPATYFPMTDAHQRLWHIVQVGPYRAFDEASRVALELKGHRLQPRLVPVASL